MARSVIWGLGGLGYVFGLWRGRDLGVWGGVTPTVGGSEPPQGDNVSFYF